MFKLSSIRKFFTGRSSREPSKRELKAELRELQYQLQRAQIEKQALRMELLDEQMRRDLKELGLKFKVEELEATNRDVKFSFQKELAIERAHGATYKKQVRQMRDSLFMRGMGGFATEIEQTAPTFDDSTTKSGPVCEICRDEYSLKAGRIPRSLECGHTMCEWCCDRMEEAGTVKCPFDRHVTQLPLIGTAGLPRNFVIIQMLDD